MPLTTQKRCCVRHPRVLILRASVLMPLYMCPRTTIYVSSCYYMYRGAAA